MNQRCEILAGRYYLYDLIASGGMASVHLCRMQGQVGFARTVAVKRMHPHFSGERNFRAMFIDEARLASHIRHPNVVQTLDVVEDGAELFIVMEYVHGLPLSRLMRLAAKRGGVPVGVASHVISGALEGLHAAHQATSEDGEPLHIVHRDVSPQNILVGTDGVSRLIDFGVAKAISQLHTTREGQVKGKLAYMAAEQIREGRVDAVTDVFSMAVVLWEVLAGRRLFKASNDGELIYKLLEAPIAAPSQYRPELSEELDSVVLRGLSRNREQRFASAREMLLALEQAAPAATQRAVAEWVSALATEDLQPRSQLLRSISMSSASWEADARRSLEPTDATDLATLPVGASRAPDAAEQTEVMSQPATPVSSPDAELGDHRGTLTESQFFADSPRTLGGRSASATRWAIALFALIALAGVGASLAPGAPAVPTLGAMTREVRRAVDSLPTAKPPPADEAKSAEAASPLPPVASDVRPNKPKVIHVPVRSTRRPPAPPTATQDYSHLYKRE